LSQQIAKESVLRDLAFYDPLTGLANRRLLSDRLDVAFSKSARSGSYGAVLFIDLDNFKAMNDKFGHARGDDLLETVASRLTKSIREEDTVARYGGDEFVVLLEDLGKNLEEAGNLAQLLAEKLHIALNILYTINLETPVDLNVSPSIGVTLFLGHDRSIDDTLERADKALYEAKNAGRDTVRFLL
jgi:diguanylate cyclase (GGDEF)-like protein